MKQFAIIAALALIASPATAQQQQYNSYGPDGVTVWSVQPDGTATGYGTDETIAVPTYGGGFNVYGGSTPPPPSPPPVLPPSWANPYP